MKAFYRSKFKQNRSKATYPEKEQIKAFYHSKSKQSSTRALNLSNLSQTFLHLLMLVNLGQKDSKQKKQWTSDYINMSTAADDL